MTLQGNETEQLASHTVDQSSKRVTRAWVNWILALLTVPAAVAVVVLAIAAAMSVAACSGGQCPDLGPSGLLYGVLLYGAPVVSGLTILASFFTAKRRLGFIVPVCGLTLLLADIVCLVVLFSR